MDSESFLLVGGVREATDGTTYASDSVDTLDLQDLAGGFDSLVSLPELDYNFTWYGDPVCAGVIEHTYTVSVEDCSDGETCQFNPCTNEAIGSCGGSTHDFGCTGDPACVHLESEHVETISAPGVWGAASWYDPVNRRMWMVGGTTGCEGLSCGDWSELFDADTMGTQSLQAANSTWAMTIEPDGDVAVHEIDMSAFTGGDWPETSSTGFAGSAGANMDAWWDPAGRAWSNSELLPPYLFGGTRYQSVAPSRVYAVEENEYSEDCPSHPIDWVETDTAGDEVFPDWADGLHGGGDGVQDWDVTGYDRTTFTTSPLLTRTMDAAAATLEAGGIGVVVGGRTSSGTTGTSTVQLFIPGWGELEDVNQRASIGNRYGASLAFDPVTEQTYLFGGHSSNTDLFHIFGPETRKAGHPYMLDGEATLTYNDSTAEWTTSTTIEFTIHCDDADCVTDELSLVFPSGDLAEVEAATVEATLRAGAYTLRMIENNLVTVDAQQLVVARYRLPEYLAEYDHGTLTVGWITETLEPAADAFDALALFTPHEVTANGGELVTFGMVPIALLTDESATATIWGDPVSFSTVTVNVPMGFTAFAPGTRGGSGNVFTDLPSMYPGWFKVLAIDSPVHVGTASGSGADVEAYRAGYLTTDAADEAKAYVTGSVESLSVDLNFLEEHWGNLGTEVRLLYWAPSPTATYSGVAYPGIALVQCFSSTGDSCESEGWDLDLVSAHELAHHWVGVRRTFEEEARFGLEGLPEFVANSLHPADDFREDGLERMVGLELTSDWDPRDSDINDRSDYYVPSAYLLSTFHHMMMADGGSSDDAWASWEDLIDGWSSQAVDAEELYDHIADQPNGASFRDQYLVPGTIGVPILGVVDVSCDVDEDTGDSGGACEVVSVEVEQVQPELYGFDLFDDVPYYVGCYPGGATGEFALAGCHSSHDVLFDEEPELTSAADVTYQVMQDAGLGWPAMPTYLGLIANGMLLPSQVPSYGVDASTTWLLRCAPGDTTGECGFDADSDGFPTTGDCDDGDNGVFPGAAETVHDGTDYNCDGWAR